MKEHELKLVLSLLNISWKEFNLFIAHKTVSMVQEENYYLLEDVKHFLSIHLHKPYERVNIIKGDNKGTITNNF